MFKEKLPLVLSTKDAIKFLDSLRLVLGFSQQQMDVIILVLAKCETCNLNFRMENILVTFNNYGDRQITVERYVKQDNYASSITFDIPQVYIQSIKRKSSIHGSGTDS